MRSIDESLSGLKAPRDYFKGYGAGALPIPENVLLFVRQTRLTLQQKALENRSHHRYVLVFNLETEGQVHLDNMTMCLRPGQALMIQPYQFHHFSHLAGTRLCWLFCTFEMSSTHFLEPLRNQLLELNPAATGARDLLLTVWKKTDTSESPSLLQEQLVQVSLLRLLVLLRQQHQEAETPLPAATGDNLLRFVNHVLNERQGKMTIGELAAGYELSVSRFRARFKQQAGVPLGRYIQNYRLNRAMNLLRTSDRPIAEVGDMAGLGTPQVFSRIFRKKTGLCPRTYRNRGRSIHRPGVSW